MNTQKIEGRKNRLRICKKDREWKGTRDHGPLEFWQWCWWGLVCKGPMSKVKSISRTALSKKLSSPAKMYFSAGGCGQVLRAWPLYKGAVLSGCAWHGLKGVVRVGGSVQA